MKSGLFLKVTLIFSLAFILSATSLHAQGNQINFDVAPQVPAPYDNVIVSITNFSTDLDRSQISWLLNGKAQQSGIGVKSFTFTAGAKGTISTVTVKVQPTNGPLLQSSITIIPQDVDILWEAKTYTPPFYKGKALHTTEADLFFVAIANFVTSKGVPVNPSTLVYKWSQDGTVLADRSGYGRNTFSYTGTILSKPVTMTVEVSTLKNDSRARKSITVTPEATMAILYENSPVYGILFNRAATDSFPLTAKEGKFEVFPYYFSGKNRSDADIQYSWKLNSAPLLVSKNQHSMVFRNETDGSGTALVNVSISNLSKLLQNASAQLSIVYGSDSLKKFFEGQ